MFKRMQKLNDKLEKERKKGTPREEQGPPEMALDDDSESSSSESSSSASSSGSSSSGSGSDAASEAKVSSSKPETNKRKRAQDDEETKEDDESDSDGSDEEEEEDSSDEEEDESDSETENDDTPVCSIAKALKDPIYIHPRAQSKANFKHRSCFLCPIAVLKTERSITVHLQGSSHGRHLKRFQQYCEKKLKDEEKKDPSKGGLNAKQVVTRIENNLQKKSEKQVKHRQLVKQAQKEKKGRKMAEKKERRMQTKAEKEEKRRKNLLLKDTLDENGKKRQITETGETVRELKKRKAKRQKKLNAVMPTKEVRKAAKKERKALKLAAKKEKAIARAKEGAAKNKAAARVSTGGDV